MTNYRNLPGPGDPETWPACNGDPMDPRTPPALPDDECDVETLCERYDASDLAVMLQAAFAENNLLRARLRKAEPDAARWQAAIAERRARDIREIELRG